MDYLFGLDRDFVMPTGVAIASLHRFLSAGDRLLVNHVGLTDADVAMLERCAPGVPMLTTDCSARLHPSWRPAGRLPSAAFCRYLAAELYPDVGRCLYVDGDVLVRSDLRELTETDLGDRTLGAVRSRVAPFLASPGGVRAWFELGLPGAAPFFNNGVLLIDLDRWRATEATAALVRFMEAHAAADTWGEAVDQEALNAVMHGEWVEVERRWNYITHVTESFLPAPEDEPTDPAVVHFAGPRKPWGHGRLPIYSDEWYQVLAATPWEGFRPEPLPVSTGPGAAARRLAGAALRRLRAAVREDDQRCP